MEQKIFKNRYLMSLKSALLNGEGLDRYTKGDTRHPDTECWAKKGLKDISSLGVRFTDPRLPEKSFDFENAKLLFEAWKEMDPTQATDPRLWAYLCHVPFMAFLRKRRPVEKQEPGKRVNFILDHWFVENPGPGALQRNDVFLFWWGPHITYDSSRRDPFELTKELFSMLDYTRHLLPGYQGRVREFTHAVLEFVMDNPKMFAEFKEAKVRFIMRKLNFMAGYRMLSSLTKKDIKTLINGFRDEIAHTRDSEAPSAGARKDVARA